MGAAMSSPAAAPAARYYFCHSCFLATALAPGTACPLCGGNFVEEIDIPPYEAPQPNPNHGLFFATGCLFSSPASFVLRSLADADAFFLSAFSPLRHLMAFADWPLPFPLQSLEREIYNLLLTRSNSGVRVYVVLVGILPAPYADRSDLEIARSAEWIGYYGRRNNTFISPATRPAVANLTNVEIDGGPQGEESCVVCMETLGIGTVAARFPCAHVFHRDCILPWLEQQHTCPVCRSSALTEETIGPTHTVFRVVIPPRPLGLGLNENIAILDETVRGNPEIPPCRWA